MTEAQLRKTIVDIAKKYVGDKESDGSFKKIIDGYNAHKPLAQGYKVKYTDAWCATFVSFVFIQAGLADIGYTECSCPRMITLYKNKGRWKEDDSYKPQPGDIIMYDWQDTGSGDNQGTADHVGIVESVSGNTMKIIEGNMSEKVGYRTLAVNAKNIRGDCLPNYASKATKEPAKPAAKPAAAAVKVDAAKYFDRLLAKNYTVTASALNMRAGAGTDKAIIKVLKKGAKVTCYGYYSLNKTTKWLFVKDADGDTGFCSKLYLK